MPELIQTPALVKRPQIMDYYNIAPVGDTPDFQYMGVGFTQADQTFGAQITGKQYINEYSQSQVLTSYQQSIAFVADMIANDKVMADVFNIANKMSTGGDVIREYIRVWAFRPVSGSANTFEATRWLATVQAENLNNDGGIVAISGSLQYFGGHQLGKFDTATKAFIEGEIIPAPEGFSARVLPKNTSV